MLDFIESAIGSPSKGLKTEEWHNHFELSEYHSLLFEEQNQRKQN